MCINRVECFGLVSRDMSGVNALVMSSLSSESFLRTRNASTASLSGNRRMQVSRRPLQDPGPGAERREGKGN